MSSCGHQRLIVPQRPSFGVTAAVSCAVGSSMTMESTLMPASASTAAPRRGTSVAVGESGICDSAPVIRLAIGQDAEELLEIEEERILARAGVRPECRVAVPRT